MLGCLYFVVFCVKGRKVSRWLGIMILPVPFYADFVIIITNQHGTFVSKFGYGMTNSKMCLPIGVETVTAITLSPPGDLSTVTPCSGKRPDGFRDIPRFLFLSLYLSMRTFLCSQNYEIWFSLFFGKTSRNCTRCWKF
jgi:hypothetical protein